MILALTKMITVEMIKMLTILVIPTLIMMMMMMIMMRFVADIMIVKTITVKLEIL